MQPLKLVPVMIKFSSLVPELHLTALIMMMAQETLMLISLQVKVMTQ